MYNDANYGLFQGSLFMQRRSINGGPIGPMLQVGDADKFEISPTQTFDDIAESRSGQRMTAAHTPTKTDVKVKANLLFSSKQNLVAGLWGTDTGAVPAGTVTAEVQKAYNNSLVPLANLGVSSVVATLAGVTGTIASVAVTAGGTGYTPGLLAITFAGTPGTGATGFAVVNAAGVITGAYVTAPGSGYAAPTATVTGGGTGATLVANMGAAALVLNTDYTVDAANGSLTILPGTTLVPAYVDTYQVGPTSGGQVSISVAYAYAAYTGKVEAFTSGIQYYTMRLQGFNIANNNQPVVCNVYQAALDMTKMLSLIEAKHNSIELDGMLLQDTLRPLPTAAAPYSQFFNIVKA